MILRGKNILITSNEPWGDTWYSKHNYAWELARRGNKVIFIDPPGGYKLTGITGSDLRLETISDHLSVLHYNNALPVRSAALYRKNNRIVSGRIAAFLQEKKIQDYWLWSFDPYRLSDARALGAAFSIFHSVDQYNFVPFGEKQLASEAGMVIAVAAPIAAQYRNLNAKLLEAGHAISDDEFSDTVSPEVRQEMPAGNPGIYVGNIDDRVDFELIEKMAVRFPGTAFVFIGNILSLPGDAAKRVFGEKKYPNVIHKGSRPFKMLRQYIAASGFCLAPMNRQHPGNTIAHHKMLQYLALGKPVFSCSFSAYAAQEKLLYMLDSEDRFLSAIEQYLQSGEAAELPVARVNYAKGFTFGTQLNRIEEALRNYYPEL